MLNVTDLDLTIQYFSHGQFYVALIRATFKQNLFMLASECEKFNMVYSEIFNV